MKNEFYIILFYIHIRITWKIQPTQIILYCKWVIEKKLYRTFGYPRRIKLLKKKTMQKKVW